MFRDGAEYGQSEFLTSSVYKIESGGAIFSKPRYTDYIEALYKVVNIKRDIFDVLYVKLLHQHAHFVQSLQVPNDKHGGCLLDRSLRRAYGLLRHCAPKVISNNGFGFDPDRLMFALFSAGLLFGIGRTFQDRQVFICNYEGEYIKTWFPNSGLMPEGYYRVNAIKSQPEEYVALMHLAYALEIMPKLGISWLMEDQKLFVMWTDALANIQQGFTDLEIELDVDKLAKGVGEDMNFEKEVHSHHPAELMEGERFLAWLKERIARDSSLVNKQGSGLYHVDAGLLIELDQLIDEYAKSHHGNISTEKIKSQFGMLGVATASSTYSQVLGSKFLGQVQQHSFEAVLVEYEKGLFESGRLGPVVQVSSQGQLSSGERFFSRIGGLAQQFMLGHTSANK